MEKEDVVHIHNGILHNQNQLLHYLCYCATQPLFTASIACLWKLWDSLKKIIILSCLHLEKFSVRHMFFWSSIFSIYCVPSWLLYWASLVAQTVKNLPAMWENWVKSLGWEDPLERGHGNPLQYSCLENPHEQRSLAGYSPWGREESDTTEQLNTPNIANETETLKKHSKKQPWTDLCICVPVYLWCIFVHF